MLNTGRSALLQLRSQIQRIRVFSMSHTTPASPSRMSSATSSPAVALARLASASTVWLVPVSAMLTSERQYIGCATFFL